MQNKASIPLQSQVKWLAEKDVVGNATFNWRNAYYVQFLCTGETKLWVFQFKFLHRRIATNDFLCMIGIKQVDSCSFCEETTETLVHLFWNCKYTQAFWKKKLLKWMSQRIINLKDSVFLPFLCLGLVENVSNIRLLHLLLIARHYIYTCSGVRRPEGPPSGAPYPHRKLKETHELIIVCYDVHICLDKLTPSL